MPDPIEVLWTGIHTFAVLITLVNLVDVWKDRTLPGMTTAERQIASTAVRNDAVRLFGAGMMAVAGWLALLHPPGVQRELIIAVLIAGGLSFPVNSICDRLDRGRLLRTIAEERKP